MSGTPRRIPLVDLSHYRSGTPTERARFVRVFGEGLREFGFVSVVGHGIDDGLIRRTYADVASLFDQPEAVKARYAVPELAGQRGYTGYGREHAKDRKVGDLKEFWHVGRELPPGHPYLGHYGANVWPEEVPSFREHTLALFRELDGAASLMLQSLAEFFGVPRTTFSDMATDGNSVLRLIHYPPLKERFIPGGVRAAEHEDINLITLLCEGTASGLELLTRDGEWLPVDTLRGQIVVDSGDMLSRVTNNVIPATTHRVVNPRSPSEDTVRYSLPFFCHPRSDCVLSPLSCTETPDNPARHAPIAAGAFLQQRLRENGLLK
ncbi:isopenicillin N synthase family oxygenase [Myxococcus stipitatus]|uniref:isopenicillin N synthase family dioxygenase n=1 Tax=Myxococcus stipitatus TaxID=83455 RepID=UPI001F308BC8|nr:2-oxoglutarate and iron-dependent oxygenase domain-containing protein [Myxococcus stipitatus]MCE9669529.1 isopenicillin N synthase family oxygenase [Myxococcus stipitatus]